MMRNFTVARGRWGRPRKQDGGNPMSENKTSENKRDYEIGRGKLPVHPT